MTTRRCMTCGGVFPIAKFQKKGTRRSRYCRACEPPKANSPGRPRKIEVLIRETKVVSDLLKSPVCSRCGARGATYDGQRFLCAGCRG